jgi:hypothetical protein
MLTYQVVSKSRRVIDGLGVFEADEPQEFTEDEEAMFRVIRGIPLNQDNVPDDVTVTIRIDEEVAK